MKFRRRLLSALIWAIWLSLGLALIWACLRAETPAASAVAEEEPDFNHS